MISVFFSYGNGDGRVTLNEIKNYLDNEMTYAARRPYGREQEATVFGQPENVIVILSNIHHHSN